MMVSILVLCDEHVMVSAPVEHQPGIRCIGAPIRDQHGRVIAGISISGPAWKIQAEQVPALAEIVTHNAKAISVKL
jgi:DNA-binding IclR family transcriptional regulator